MKMNKLAIAVGAAVMGLASAAQADLTGNIGATSNYMWRGMTQTSKASAISGGLDYSFGDTGFAVGTWTSNTSFGSPELDLYGSYSGSAGPLGYSVGFINVRYPTEGNNSINFSEINASLTYSILTVGMAHEVQAGVTAFGKNSNYYYATVSKDVGKGWSIGGTIGHYSIKASEDLSVPAGSYTYGEIDVTKSAGDYGDFTLSLAKAGSSVDPYVGPTGNKLTPFVSWTKTF